ncbi:MAG: S1/P1 nuclease [Muribaculaceae bacterium]|nr:S1/P1 nuclease [Muribaculaceae bacterium]
MTLRNYILVAAIAFAAAPSALAWGQKGHDVTAYIAEQHLTEATRAAVDSLLEGKSMVYWANWLDNASHTRPFAYTKTWHYKNIDAGERYEEAQANPAGDAVLAIKAQLETLQDPHKSFDDKQLAMKILVHVVGDIHQPMHMGHATDLGGNRVKVKFFGRDNNLHSVWDSNIVESGHKWGFTEWQMMIDRATPAQEAEIIGGSIDDWAKQSAAIAATIYEETPEGSNLSYNEVARWTPVIEDQLLNGGLRLAHLLNTLFDPEY